MKSVFKILLLEKIVMILFIGQTRYKKRWLDENWNGM